MPPLTPARHGHPRPPQLRGARRPPPPPPPPPQEEPTSRPAGHTGLILPIAQIGWGATLVALFLALTVSSCRGAIATPSILARTRCMVWSAGVAGAASMMLTGLDRGEHSWLVSLATGAMIVAGVAIPALQVVAPYIQAAAPHVRQWLQQASAAVARKATDVPRYMARGATDVSRYMARTTADFVQRFRRPRARREEDDASDDDQPPLRRRRVDAPEEPAADQDQQHDDDNDDDDGYDSDHHDGDDDSVHDGQDGPGVDEDGAVSDRDDSMRGPHAEQVSPLRRSARIAAAMPRIAAVVPRV